MNVGVATFLATMVSGGAIFDSADVCSSVCGGFGTWCLFLMHHCRRQSAFVGIDTEEREELERRC
jgi:hypothetical protein